MKQLNKLAFAISAASAMVLGISQAQAFDRSDWDWDLDVDTYVDQDIDINVGLDDPSGLALAEIDQTFTGSVSATSNVTNIDNMVKPDKTIDADWWSTGHGKGGVDVDINYDYSAIGNGAIESAATAVANNASVETDVQTNLDSNQIWYGSGSISASSTVAGIDNMTVDSAATAVGNNLSLDLQANTAADSILLANINQVGTGSVSAYSYVNDVSLMVTDPGTLKGPEISSVATAVGNNVNVSLGSFSN
ncbi:MULTISPECIES: hypothetical protein [Halomonadaceae]|uniref:Uncharacterized protein n=1 Tax=Modicisalibacter zincidurans TaxID=1178777 RepID=A0ABP9R916_9GAMM|nr:MULTISPECIES: hypothetical protein [Halomonas]MCD6008069.1 hypothetical protein [Halomonas sp. IOP_31]MEA3250362.1 hypothetical protein [Pseudomonadota bacterium]